jgi:acyl-CoA thioesterase FadM
MSQIVTIRLTLAEARAVSQTMSNHIDSDDHQGQLALYGKTSTIHAAHRAHARVSQAIRDTLTRKRS